MASRRTGQISTSARAGRPAQTVKTARSAAAAPTSSPASAAAAAVLPAPARSSAPALVPAALPTFAELGIPRALTERLEAEGITAPFPIQAAALPDALAGRDLLCRGRTGSGKTLGFLLPTLARLAAQPRPRRPKRPRALILAPTRELAAQIHAAAQPLAAAVGLRTAAVFGGVGARPQISALNSGIDLLVACPGRLIDHLESGHAVLDGVEVTVLDEADHMADLGFLPAVERILNATPRDGQRLLFSATLDNGVDRLVRRHLTDPVTHAVDSPHSEVPDMSHHLLHVEAADRVPILIELTGAPGRTIVFARTKHGARKLTRQLTAAGVAAVELHGNLAQNARTRNLEAFSEGRATTLVATDIAARGIHVDEIEVVVHADPPVEYKAYLHRSGRTARAGSSGTVITLMTDAQVGEVRELTRKARVKAATTRLRPGDPLIKTLAPGERTPASAEQIAALSGAGRTGNAGQATDGSEATAGGGGGRSRRGRQRKAAAPKAGQTATSRTGSATTGRGGSAAGRGGSAVNGRSGSSATGRGGSAVSGRGGSAAQGTGGGERRTGSKTSGAKNPIAKSAAAKSSGSGGAAAASRNFRGRGGAGR
ncbi:MAG TPA: DEAD/DEAH box helicase [Actinospica sp.]|nr:DEAD/DEAH box helicase [Actinospica sp.]